MDLLEIQTVLASKVPNKQHLARAGKHACSLQGQLHIGQVDLASIVNLLLEPLPKDSATARCNQLLR